MKKSKFLNRKLAENQKEEKDEINILNIINGKFLNEGILKCC